MAKDINLTSQQWNDIIFEGKNKDYGAYEMRQSSSKRHVIALLSTLILAVFVAILPVLAKQIEEWRHKPSDGLIDDVNLRDLQMQKEAEQEKILEELAKPEEPLLKSDAFVAPDITDASNITDDNQLRNMEDLSKSENIISIKNVIDGVEEGGIDIARLEENWKIAGDTNGILTIDKIEVFPEFPGGERELTKFLQNNLVYPEDAKRMGVEGKVMIQFVVNKNGSITDVTVQGTPPRSLSNEAVRVVKSMPKWIPGRQNGRPVNVYFRLPIEFELN